MSTKDKERKRAKPDASPKRVEASKKPKTEEVKVMSDLEVFNLEAEESKQRDHTADLNTFKETVEAVKESLTVIKDLKKGKDATAPAEILEHRIFTSLAIARLRKLNRLGHLGCARAKDTTNEKRSTNDQYHLRLQNLLYEVGHLQKEINKCLEFRSKDEELKLVPVEQFYKDAPVDISKPEVTKEDPHEQRKARLQWELEQRKTLAEQLSEAKVKIEQSQNDIQNRETNLESLVPKLSKILEATKPVQDYFGMALDVQREQYQTAKLLPQPLFVLYRNLNALEQQDKNGKLKVMIEGDVDAAKQYSEKSAAVDDDSDSDQEEEKHKVSKHRKRMTSCHEEDAETRVLKMHPLYIILDLTCQRSSAAAGPAVKVQLAFMYMSTMDMVTVKGRLKESAPHSSIAAGDLMQIDAILSCACPGDKGDVTPNPVSQFQLDKLTPSNLGAYRAKIGTPFKWVQTISGLNILSADPTEPKLAGVAALVKKIRRQILDRVELVHQITELERCHITVPVMSSKVLPNVLPTTQLHHWHRSTYEDLSSLTYSNDYIDTGAVTDDYMVYQAKLTCGPMRILAHVAINGDYPTTKPIVMIQFEEHKSGVLNRTNSDMVASIEEEVNTFVIKHGSDSSNILNLLLVKLAWCCDVYMAITSMGTSQENAVSVKFVPTAHRGRDRQLPFTYNPNTGFFSHDVEIN